MYLDHFGLREPPFRITPSTTFFYSGANRGDILDALIYSLSEVEGIVKVSGEVGSGKTMLCRMLIERLPRYIETVYLANPSLSRDEMLYAIADGLGVKVEGERIGVIMHVIESRLAELARDGKRVIVLVDEAHAMPSETLEELRLLYNLQVGNFKLLQIILFGQPELNSKLEQPNMRQLKDRIVHHFVIQPISLDTLESYLMFRMRTAGYHGPNIFSAPALKLIGQASTGLMRRVNILADKSLLAAFVEDTHNVDARHVEAAMRDSDMQPPRRRPDWKPLAAGAAVVILLAFASWWLAHDSRPPQSLPAPSAVVPTPVLPPPAAPPAAAPAPDTSPTTATPVAPLPAVGGSLFNQRLAAGKQLLLQKNIAASIQLYSQDIIQPQRVEGFLKRAQDLGKLQEIYLVPVKYGKKEGLRVLYGAYPTIEAARNAIQDLPLRYRQSFAATIHVF